MSPLGGFGCGISIDVAKLQKVWLKHLELTERFEGLSLPQICSLSNAELLFSTDLTEGSYERTPDRIVINSVLEPDEQREIAVYQLTLLELDRSEPITDISNV